jgi:DNA-binding transcriptional ArsR family regulator
MTRAPKTDPRKRTAVSHATATLKALANEHRLLLLCSLAERPMSVSELNLRVPIAQSALSQHLARLRAAKVVVAQRRGVQTQYALSDARAGRLVAAVCGEYGVGQRPGGASDDGHDHAERAAVAACPAR